MSIHICILYLIYNNNMQISFPFSCVHVCIDYVYVACSQVSEKREKTAGNINASCQTYITFRFVTLLSYSTLRVCSNVIMFIMLLALVSSSGTKHRSSLWKAKAVSVAATLVVLKQQQSDFVVGWWRRRKRWWWFRRRGSRSNNKTSW